jgi:salicylate hydroxylase
MNKAMVIAGAGMGGLSAGIAMGLMGQEALLVEKKQSFTELGAGIQLGPNATRILEHWGMIKSLEAHAARPERVEVFRWDQDHALAQLELGAHFRRRYGAPYLTIHRADLQASLLERLLAIGQTELRLGTTLSHLNDSGDGVELELNCAMTTSGLNAQALIGADGVSSQVRRLHWPAQHIQATPHLAYRATIAQNRLPLKWRQSGVRVFMGPQMHWVQYPIRSGEWLNIVALVEAPFDSSHQRAGLREPLLQTWHEEVPLEQTREHFRGALKGANAQLIELFGAVHEWSAWRLFDADPLRGPEHMALGHLALLGDAAHPMLPFLAQGAGMSIEDAHALAKAWSQQRLSVPRRLEAYAQDRWRRNARVQSRARANARIFHASGVLAGLRDWGLRQMGEKLLDMPWLYGHQG